MFLAGLGKEKIQILFTGLWMLRTWGKEWYYPQGWMLRTWGKEWYYSQGWACMHCPPTITKLDKVFLGIKVRIINWHALSLWRSSWRERLDYRWACITYLDILNLANLV